MKAQSQKSIGKTLSDDEDDGDDDTAGVDSVAEMILVCLCLMKLAMVTPWILLKVMR